MDNFNISVFGCWNTGCKEDSGQKSVINLLKKNENKYEFLVILGDNYYAKKHNLSSNLKIKMTKLKEAENGFECLNNINLEKKLIMGNHDINDSLDKSCSILKSQLKLPWYDIKFPYSFDLYYLNNDITHKTILMVYLDTSLYDESYNDNNTCYFDAIGKNIMELKQQQNNFIINTLKTIINNSLYNISNVIFFGHEPLLTHKYSKPTFIKELLELLFEEKKKYQDINFYWICADYHIYQNTIITDLENNNQIHQWIFGTGGGELDNLGILDHFIYLNKFKVNILPNIVYNSSGINISEEYMYYGVNKYGYGDITINMSTITHKFIQSDFDYSKINNTKKNKKVNENNKINNTYENTNNEIKINNDEIKNKYLKYKHKYLNLKLRY